MKARPPNDKSLERIELLREIRYVNQVARSPWLKLSNVVCSLKEPVVVYAIT